MKNINGKKTFIFSLFIFFGALTLVYVSGSPGKNIIDRVRVTFFELHYSDALSVPVANVTQNKQALDDKNNEKPKDQEYFVFADDEPSNVYEEKRVEIQEPEIETAKMIPLCGLYPCYSGVEFLDLYDSFEKDSGLLTLGKYIYQEKDIDNYIKSYAERRGYQERVFVKESDIISFENVQTRPEVRDAYIAIRNEMLKEGIRLHLVSGYRSSTSQRSIFKKKLGSVDITTIPLGSYDTEINKVLSVSSIPGYSKHHSGYAVDFGCGNDYLVYRFAETECFDWMSAHNFENTKRFGFIPSYPEGVELQGPNPEPWEFVWVGEDFVKNKQ